MALAEDLWSIPIIHMVAYHCLSLHSQASNALFWYLKAQASMRCIHTHTPGHTHSGEPHTHTLRINKSLKIKKWKKITFIVKKTT